MKDAVVKLARSESVERKDWFTPYRPIRLGGHAQTLIGNYWRRPPFALKSEAAAVEVDARDGSRVLCHCHWQPMLVRAERLTVVLVHGLEGSSDSGYIRGIATLAWAAGCNVIRMNMRNCGGTEDWTPTLYHSGLSGDVRVVMEYFVAQQNLTRVAMAGYSMGGNLVLKLAGELGDSAPAWLIAAAVVCPAADLGPSADALHEPANRIYELHFLRNLMRRFRRKAGLYPQIYGVGNIGPVRTIREFDHRITARFSGFSGADDYYERSSAARVVDRITIPTLVLHALDDPFIRMMPGTRVALSENAAVELIETHKGGHCAFLAMSVRTAKMDSEVGTGVAKTGEVETGALGGVSRPDSRHWAEVTVVRFLMAAGQGGPRHGS